MEPGFTAPSQQFSGLPGFPLLQAGRDESHPAYEKNLESPECGPLQEMGSSDQTILPVKIPPAGPGTGKKIHTFLGWVLGWISGRTT